MNLAYNDDELLVIKEAAAREGMAPAAWVARAALAVAMEKLVPVSVDAKDVLQELIRARNELARIGNNWNQIALALNAGGAVTSAQLEAVGVRVQEGIRRVDEATLQVMRERRDRA